MQRFATWMAGTAMAVAAAGGGNVPGGISPAGSLQAGNTRAVTANLPSVSITGPSSVRPNTTCEWLAEASGGTPPYSWDWSGGTTIYEDEGYYLARYSSSFTVTVQITDAAGQTATDSHSVNVSSNAPACIL
jgi:hypothetical protein